MLGEARRDMEVIHPSGSTGAGAAAASVASPEREFAEGGNLKQVSFDEGVFCSYEVYVFVAIAASMLEFSHLVSGSGSRRPFIWIVSALEGDDRGT